VNEFRPRLRQELVVQGNVLRDPLGGAMHPLSPVAQQVAQALDGRTPVQSLLAAVARSTRTTRAAVEREIRQLMLLGFVEGSCDGARARLANARAGEELPGRFLEGSRFGCQNTGACCQGYVFGPLREAEAARIEALDVARALPHLAGRTLLCREQIDGQTRIRLATDGDRCIFLVPGPKCGLHAAFGPQAKPALCQLYPIAALATVEGLKVYDRGECASFAVSARSGASLEEDLPRIRALANSELYHPAVWIHRTLRCDYGLVLSLTHRLDAEARGAPPLDALMRIGQVARGFLVEAAHCPIAFGQPDAAMSDFLARPTSELAPQATTATANVHTGFQVLEMLANALTERVAPAEPLAPPFIGAARLLSALAAWHLRGEVPGESAQSALGIAPGEDVHATLTLSLRQQLFGRELLVDEKLPAGLLRIAFAVAMTYAGARLRAAEESAPRIAPWHVSLAHTTAQRMLRRPAPHALLSANGDHAWTILDALPRLFSCVGCPTR
jgi:Fe-S-cluster containining protein